MKKLIIVVLITLSFALFMFYLNTTYPTTSPLKSTIYFVEHIFKPHFKMHKESIGFLPYWRINDSKYTRLDLITEVNYFALFANENGEFVTIVNGETNPGYREWESKAVKDLIAKTQIMGAEFTLTIAVQNNTAIESILDDKNAQEKLIANIISQIKSRRLDGINIDFEYLGDVDEENKLKFTEFSKRLNDKLNKESPKAKLSVSVMPRAARSKDLFDFKSLVPIYDKFIVMSYDYAGMSNAIADATAPMTGFKKNKFFFDVTTTYEDYLKIIPEEKIIMGVPHYGWDWAVEEGKSIQSKTLSSDDPNNYAAVISYARAKEDKNLKKKQCKFDDIAKQPWCWYIDPKTKIDHQVWFENEKSIGIKYDFAVKQNFKGIAIWVLGYDKNYPYLWNLLIDKFGQ